MYRTHAAFHADINVTPMIDVLLVLMIVFMLAQVRIRPVMDVMIPASPAGGQSSPSIVLELTGDGGYLLNGSPVAPALLPARLAEVFEGRPRSLLFIRSAPELRYREVIAAVDVAKGAGVSVVSFLPRS